MDKTALDIFWDKSKTDLHIIAFFDYIKKKANENMVAACLAGDTEHEKGKYAAYKELLQIQGSMTRNQGDTTETP